MAPAGEHDGSPPLDAQYVFSVAARHLSFTAAAAELHRTQSAGPSSATPELAGYSIAIAKYLFALRPARPGITAALACYPLKPY